MNRIPSVIAIMVFTQSLCCFTANAQQATPQATFNRWDKDGSGFLSKDELPAYAQRNFKRVDSNSDGKISLQEHRAFLKPRASKQLNVQRDIEYVENGHERHKLDLYLPPKADGKAKTAEKAGKRPLIVWIHGGGWKQGSKDRCRASGWVNEGYVVASINYRLSSHAVFPAQIHDCKAAIRWLRANADKYGIDEQRIGVWGSSAGGHLVALLGTSGDVKNLEGDIGVTDQSSRVQAVCDWFGPTDLLLMNAQSTEGSRVDHDSEKSPESLLLGATLQTVPEKARVAAPLTYVTDDDPPFMIVHGDNDMLVPWQQSQMLYDSLKKQNCDVTLQIIKGGGHGGFKGPEVTESCLKFFNRTLKPGE